LTNLNCPGPRGESVGTSATPQGMIGRKRPDATDTRRRIPSPKRVATRESSPRVPNRPMMAEG